MKKIIYLVILALTMPLLFNSCAKEETDDRDAFVGTWQVSETWTNSYGSGTDNYTMTISESSTSSNSVVITNFGGVGFTATATISGSSITIPVQIDDGDSFSGSGSINGSVMTFTYSVVDGWTGTCTATKL